MQIPGIDEHYEDIMMSIMSVTLRVMTRVTMRTMKSIIMSVMMMLGVHYDERYDKLAFL